MIYPKVSIIILNWNGLEDTIKCLESLKKITYPNYEVIVVDNGSRGNDADVLEEKYKGYINLIKNKTNLGFAEGNNIAIRKVIEGKESKYVFLLNNDTAVEPDFLDKIVEFAEHPGNKIGMFQSKILKYNNRKIIDSTGHKKYLGVVFDRGVGQEDKGQFDKKRKIFGAMGAAVLYKREMLQEIGLFDRNFFAYVEDVELDFRARKIGWKARFVPESIVYHKGGATSIQNPQLFNELSMRNTLLVVGRWYSAWDKILLILRWSVEILINTIKVVFKLDTIENIAQRRKIIRDKLRYILMIWSKKFRSKFKDFQKTNK